MYHSSLAGRVACAEKEGEGERKRSGERDGGSSWADLAAPEQVIQCNDNTQNNIL